MCYSIISVLGTMPLRLMTFSLSTLLMVSVTLSVRREVMVLRLSLFHIARISGPLSARTSAN
jgi:hypothetical protein